MSRSDESARSAALTRRLVFDCVDADLDEFLSRKGSGLGDDSFVSILRGALLDCPLFRGDEGMADALQELFEFIPKIEQKMVRRPELPPESSVRAHPDFRGVFPRQVTARTDGKQSGMRKRIARMICSPIERGNSSMQMQAEADTGSVTAGQEKYAAKNKLVAWVQQPRGAHMFVTAIMQSHSLTSLPAPLREYVEAKQAEAVDNLVHQLAKDGPR
jgi:hypothetical protein